MSGRWISLFLIGFASIFGVALWYFQTRAYYGKLPPEAVHLQLRRADGEALPLPVLELRAIDAGTSPLKFRACFMIAMEQYEIPMDVLNYEHPVPLVAPGWFSCFDAGAIARDLAAGGAAAFLDTRGIAPGADRVLAIYPDGRGFAWHQLGEEFMEK